MIIFIGEKETLRSLKKLRQKLNQKTIFGHPKFDLCKKPFIDFYKKEIDELKKRYKKFVFFF